MKPVLMLMGLALVLGGPAIVAEEHPDDSWKEKNLDGWRDYLLKRIDERSKNKVFTETVARDLEKEVGTVVQKMGRLKAKGELTEEDRRTLKDDFRAVEKKIRAQVDDPINERKESFHGRIEKGIKEGSLTESEAKNLEKEFDRIVEKEERYRADGNFTSGERQILTRDMEALSKKIAREKHDSQRQR